MPPVDRLQDYGLVCWLVRWETGPYRHPSVGSSLRIRVDAPGHPLSSMSSRSSPRAPTTSGISSYEYFRSRSARSPSSTIVSEDIPCDPGGPLPLKRATQSPEDDETQVIRLPQASALTAMLDSRSEGLKQAQYDVECSLLVAVSPKSYHPLRVDEKTADGRRAGTGTEQDPTCAHSSSSDVRQTDARMAAAAILDNSDTDDALALHAATNDLASLALGMVLAIGRHTLLAVLFIILSSRRLRTFMTFLLGSAAGWRPPRTSAPPIRPCQTSCACGRYAVKIPRCESATKDLHDRCEHRTRNAAGRCCLGDFDLYLHHSLLLRATHPSSQPRLPLRSALSGAWTLEHMFFPATSQGF
ncbi:hypothetical protein C8Q76DRAFT_861043 [Earliella scabrosa]|nr:hypothetical protein C8Q76DRAFT_861043 [Earliella scabrosa]